MQAGYSEIDITPPIRTELGGYGYYLGRRMRGVLDPLYARCVVIKLGDGKLRAIDNRPYIVIVSCDIVQLGMSVINKVRHALKKDGYAADQVMLVATHSHTAPITGAIEGCGAEDEAYAAVLPDLIIRAIRAAEADIADVTSVYTTRARAMNVAYNRTSPDGPVDDYVRGVLMERAGRPPIALINFACHPVTLGRLDMASADYPGRVAARMKKRGTNAIFLNGPCGDIDPVSNRDAWGSGTEATIERYAEHITDAFEAGLTPAEFSDWTVRTTRFDVNLRNEPVDIEYIQSEVKKAVDESGEDAPQMRARRAWAAALESALLKGVDLSAEVFTAPVVSIGPVVLIGLPFEVYTKTGQMIRATLPDNLVLVMGCAEQTRGYLPTIDEYERGAYGARESMFLYLRAPIAQGEAEAIAVALGERIASWLKI